MVHTSFATKSSSLFCAALKNDWKEAHEKRIDLPGTKVVDLQSYLQWLYTGRIAELNYDESPANSATLIRLYILGDYLGDSRFSNAVIDTLLENSSYVVSGMVFESSTVDLAWEKTSPGSPLRRLLVSFIIGDIRLSMEQPIFKDFGAWSKEVSAAVFAQMGRFDGVRVATADSVELPVRQGVNCDYHKHDKEYPECSESRRKDCGNQFLSAAVVVSLD